MKIAITATSPDWSAKVDPRFGRADYILIIDEDTDTLEAIDNRSVINTAHGAGPQTAQKIYDKSPNVLITGNGPGANAAAILKRMHVEVYIGAAEMNIRDALQAYKNNKLRKGD